MKRLLFSLFIFSFSLFCTPSVFGQKCSDYACVIANVKKAMSAKNYRLAFEQLESAEGYPNKNAIEITKFRTQLFDAVENEKERAESERRKAIAQKDSTEKEKKRFEKLKMRADTIIVALSTYLIESGVNQTTIDSLVNDYHTDVGIIALYKKVQLNINKLRKENIELSNELKNLKINRGEIKPKTQDKTKHE